MHGPGGQQTKDRKKSLNGNASKLSRSILNMSLSGSSPGGTGNNSNSSSSSLNEVKDSTLTVPRKEGEDQKQEL